MRIIRTISVAVLAAYWAETYAQENPDTVQPKDVPTIQRGIGYSGPNGLERFNVAHGIRPQPKEYFESSEPHKYRPPLAHQQIAHPSNYYEQYLVALSAYDEDLVRVAQVRFSSNAQRLAWLEKAQQQRDANNINKTKPLIYPVR
jgi:hypothetical protein